MLKFRGDKDQNTGTGLIITGQGRMVTKYFPKKGKFCWNLKSSLYMYVHVGMYKDSPFSKCCDLGLRNFGALGTEYANCITWK